MLTDEERDAICHAHYRAGECSYALAERVERAVMKKLGEQEAVFEVGRHGKSGDYFINELPSKVKMFKGMKLYAHPLPAQSVPEGSVTVSAYDLKRIHRDLDACQKVIWLAGGFDPAYCNDAQESLRLIDAMLSAATKP